MALAVRVLDADDRPQLGGFLRDGGAPDAFLRDQLTLRGPGSFLGVDGEGALAGAALVRNGAVTAASGTTDDAARALARRIAERWSWVSVVGPEEPCGIISTLLRNGAPATVDRVQVFMKAERGEPICPPEPTLRPAAPADVPALVPLVARYRHEDGLSRHVDQARAWVRTFVTERVERGTLFVVEQADRIVFTGAFNYVGPDGAGLGGIYTVPSARGEGIASRATAAMVALAHERGPVATLHVDPRNAPALRCYEKVGFVRDGHYRLTFR